MLLEQYISTISNEGLRIAVRDNASNIYDKATDCFDFHSVRSGLLLGNVQSGKTAQMLGAIAHFADKGYKLFIVLTSDITDLQRQTIERTRKSLQGFEVLDENDTVRFQGERAAKPILIVLKKNGRVLKKWKELLLSSRVCQGKTLVVFDDEGDNASLNTLVNNNRRSTINRNLEAIKQAAFGCIYISVTATPQAILLQSTVSNWKPSFVHYFEPGNGYIGGNFFYPSIKPYCIEYTGENELGNASEEDSYYPDGLQKSILCFLLNCAHKKMNGENNCNFMIHPSVRVNVHEQFNRKVRMHLSLLATNATDSTLRQSLKEVYDDLRSSKPDIEDFEDLLEVVMSILEEMNIRILTLNSKSTDGRNPDNSNGLNLNDGFNIVVGGNTLGRGVTFPHLQVVYYCRNSKTPQADTSWQHSRIFGYDREREMVRLYMPESLFYLFSELNKSNNILINQICQHGLDSVDVVYPYGIRPTRKSVLDNARINVVMGGVNMFPRNPIMDNTSHIDHLLDGMGGIDFVDVSGDMVKTLLGFTGSVSNIDYDANAMIGCIEALETKRPKIKYRLLIRRNRDISRGTGTLLSENDRTLVDSDNVNVVLALYRLNGAVQNGWNGNPLWVPNIKFPRDCCFYSVD